MDNLTESGPLEQGGHDQRSDPSGGGRTHNTDRHEDDGDRTAAFRTPGDTGDDGRTDSWSQVDRRTFLKLSSAGAALTGFGASKRASAQAGYWTLVALPDTQYYANSSTRITYAQEQTNWIVNNLGAENIAFVTHEGDVVHRGDVLNQWKRMDGVMDTLDGQVPYSVLPGDHDWAVESDRSSSTQYFRQYFGTSRYSGRGWYGGSAPNDLSHYQYFSAGGYDFLHIALEWEVPGSGSDPSSALGWAQQILDQNSARPTIITTHSHIQDGSSPGWSTVVEEVNGIGNSGQQVWQELITSNPQVFMVLNGHYHKGSGSNKGEYHQVSTNSAGLPVYEMLANYQSGYNNGGSGYMRLLQFHPGGGSDGQDRIQVKTYSPSLDAFITDGSSQFSFDLDFASRFSLSQSTTPPLAPSDLSASAVSSSEINLSWVDNANDESRYEIERSSGSEPFSQAGSVGSNVTSFADKGLSAGTTYTYRVRAVNNAGPSDYSNEASATTETGSTTGGTVTFQQGQNGYSGTLDTFLREARPDANRSTSVRLFVDSSDPDGLIRQALVRFENIIGSETGQIPAGSSISSATLTLETLNGGDGASLHRMLTNWSDTASWNSFGGDGIQSDGVEAEISPDATTGSTSGGSTTIDVTSSIQAWVNGQTNRGWAFLPNGNNGWAFSSTEGTTPPKLEVTFE